MIINEKLIQINTTLQGNIRQFHEQYGEYPNRLIVNHRGLVFLEEMFKSNLFWQLFRTHQSANDDNLEILVPSEYCGMRIVFDPKQNSEFNMEHKQKED